MLTDILSNINLNAIISGLFGVTSTLLGGWMVYLQEKKSKESFASAILYNDLLSIERYLKYGSGSVNLRYSENWQHMVSYCTFLTVYEVEFIYGIYDEVYDYNYDYKSKENNGKFRKEDIKSYGILRNEMFSFSKGDIETDKNSVRYQRLKENLKKHMALQAY